MRTLFVYGLLRPGFTLHHLVEPFVERMVEGRARGTVYDVGVPAGRFDEDGDVTGVVMWLDEQRLEEAFRLLDEVEDEGVEYRRITVAVQTPDGPIEAFAYEYLLEIV